MRTLAPPGLFAIWRTRTPAGQDPEGILYREGREEEKNNLSYSRLFASFAVKKSGALYPGVRGKKSPLRGLDVRLRPDAVKVLARAQEEVAIRNGRRA